MIQCRNFILILVSLCTLMLVGCGDITEKLYGAWKSESPSPDTGKAVVLVLTQNTLTMGGETREIIYKPVSLNVEVADKASGNLIFMASNIDKDFISLQGGPVTDKTRFLRITEDEAKQLTGQ